MPQPENFSNLLILTLSENGKLAGASGTASWWRSGTICCSTPARSRLVNYESFGFTKTVSRNPEDKFAAVAEIPLFTESQDHLYELAPESNKLVDAGKCAIGHVSKQYLDEPPTDEEVVAI
ncbi:hypothetical protein GSI_02764 [Ganoderma sinense ZZ0214-1]|uniref:Uncharacterized protein n=1 Tax=Ganoderma sinense ZZ0214-1 TaxID=1077348 RepID=A0A2G8SMI0_9APHY|nr:hypothetical protein GSI_02764 [Ganoderma sinense ZZ0214-1]